MKKSPKKKTPPAAVISPDILQPQEVASRLFGHLVAREGSEFLDLVRTTINQLNGHSTMPYIVAVRDTIKGRVSRSLGERKADDYDAYDFCRVCLSRLAGARDIKLSNDDKVKLYEMEQSAWMNHWVKQARATGHRRLILATGETPQSLQDRIFKSPDIIYSIPALVRVLLGQEVPVVCGILRGIGQIGKVYNDKGVVLSAERRNRLALFLSSLTSGLRDAQGVYGNFIPTVEATEKRVEFINSVIDAFHEGDHDSLGELAGAIKKMREETTSPGKTDNLIAQGFGALVSAIEYDADHEKVTPYFSTIVLMQTLQEDTSVLKMAIGVAKTILIPTATEEELAAMNEKSRKVFEKRKQEGQAALESIVSRASRALGNPELITPIKLPDPRPKTQPKPVTQPMPFFGSQDGM